MTALVEPAVAGAVAGLAGDRLALAPELLGELEQRAAAGYPLEVCGLLLGRRCADGWQLETVTEGANLAVERQEDRYILDPVHYLEADRLARRRGLDVVGVWHTHPDHPPIPSVTDREHAFEDFVYLIVPTTEQGAGDSRAFRLDGGDFRELAIDKLANNKEIPT